MISFRHIVGVIVHHEVRYCGAQVCGRLLQRGIQAQERENPFIILKILKTN